MLVSAVEVHADLLSDGWAEYNKGNYVEAYDLFSKAFRADPGNVNINFALGEAAYQKKKYSHAVFAYDRVLSVMPAHQKARFGKARALLALNQPEDARAEFAILLAADLKPEVRENIKTMIGEIDKGEQRWRYEGSVAVSVFYDNNVNFGPAEDVINTVSGALTVSGASAKKDAWGTGLSASGTATYDAGDKGNWFAVGGASLYKTQMGAAANQETFYTRLFSGARRVERDRLTELLARYDMLNYGHHHLLDVYGLDASQLRVLDKNDYLIGRLSLEFRDFDTDVSNNGRDSIYTAGTASWKHFFTNRRNQTELAAGLFSDYANAGVNRNYGLLLRAGGEMELPKDVIGYASFQYRAAAYDDNMAGTFADARDDDQYTWTTGVRRPVTGHWTVDLQYRYTRNDSNIGLYDYDRHQATLTATRKF